eukprot:scpid86387/ scgid28200/ 
MPATRRQVKSFRQALREFDSSWENLITIIEKWGNEAKELHQTERIVAATGNGVAAAGAGLTIVGGILTVFTFGAATPLLLTGIGLGIAGATTSGIGAIVEKVKEKGIKGEVADAQSEFDSAKERFETQCKEMRTNCSDSDGPELVDGIQLSDIVLVCEGFEVCYGITETAVIATKTARSVAAVSARVTARTVTRAAAQGALSAAVGGVFVVFNTALMVKSLVDIAKDKPGELADEMFKYAESLRKNLDEFRDKYPISRIL